MQRTWDVNLKDPLEYQCEVNRLLIESGYAEGPGAMLSGKGMRELDEAFRSGRTPEEFAAYVLINLDLFGEMKRTRVLEQREREQRIAAEAVQHEMAIVAEHTKAPTAQQVSRRLALVLPDSEPAYERPLEQSARMRRIADL